MSRSTSQIECLTRTEIHAISGGKTDHSRTDTGLPHRQGDRHVGESAAGAFWRLFGEVWFGSSHRNKN